MKKLWLIRKDQEAVSPVIATILMVAITVVLAAVLYVMVSGLLSGPGAGPRSLGINKETSGDGSKWELTITTAPSGLTTTGASATMLTVFKADGSTNLTGTALGSLTYSSHGAIFSGDGDTTVEVTERILLLKSWYGTGTKVQISDPAGILYSTTM